MRNLAKEFWERNGWTAIGNENTFIKKTAGNVVFCVSYLENGIAVGVTGEDNYETTHIKTHPLTTALVDLNYYINSAVNTPLFCGWK